MGRIDRPSLTAATVGLLARRTPVLEPELAGLAQIVGPGCVCVDVGSAAGLYTVTLAQLVGAAGQVHSVEPLSFAHPVWSRVLRARSGQNVRHHTVALGAEPGTGTMSVPVGRRGPVTGRSFLAWKTDGVGSNAEFAGQLDVAVDVATLDDLCAQAGLSRLDFVKIDVEGGELNVLRGGQHTVATYRPAMLIEIEARHITRYRHSTDDVVGWLTQRGYTMHAWRDGWQATDQVSPDIRNYLFRPTPVVA
jgi:FkbM family methyltransferase